MDVKYIIDHINPQVAGFWRMGQNGNREWITRRPGIFLDWDTITIHNTGNPNSTASGERRWLENPSNTTQASYHIVVDDKEAIEVLPLNEVAWHAGERNGNRTSLGIEICESGNYYKTVQNATEIVAWLLSEKEKQISDLRQHFDWSRKDCPWKIRRGHEGWTWDKFKQETKKRMVVEMVSKYFKDIRHQWQAVHVDSLREKGIISGRTSDTFDPDSPITRAEVAVVVNKTIEFLSKGE